MLMFENPLLEEEVYQIYTNNLPEHTTTVTMIIHTELEDYYPTNVVGMDVVRDYDGSLTDRINISMIMGLGEFNKAIYDERDKLQITIILNYNGKKYEERYKAVVLSDPIDDMQSQTEEFKDTMAINEIVFECVPLEYALIKSITTNGVISGVTIEDIINYHILTSVSNIKIDSKPLIPLIDIVPPHNTRVYNNVIINDKITILDIPTYLHSIYGVYNGGVGTYLYRDIDSKFIIAVYPLCNSEHTSTIRKLIIYIPDNINPAKATNKTTMLDNGELKIIVANDYNEVGRTDDLADFDFGSGFATTNTNQILDRVHSKIGDVVNVNSGNYIDSIKTSSRNNMESIKVLDSSDNLYAIRSMVLKNKSYIRSMQWNFSRPDYLVPAMAVEMIYNYNGTITIDKGVLISSHSRYDNSYKNCTTRLNVLIN